MKALRLQERAESAGHSMLRHGEAPEVPMVHDDITSIEHAFAELREEADLLLSFRESPVLLAKANRDRFVAVAGGWEAVLGWSPKELKSRPWLDFVHPDDVDSTKLTSSMMEDNPVHWTFKNRYRTKDGRWVLLAWFARKWGADGTTYAVAFAL